MARIQAFWSWFQARSRAAKTWLIVGAIVVLLIACGGIGEALGGGGSPSTGGGVAQATSTATSAPSPTAAATIKATATAYTGPAVFGAPLSAFVTRYGPSQATDPTINDFPTDANRDADILVKVGSNGLVDDLVLTAFNATWDDQQTIAACVPFLPPGAAQFNATGPYIDYHTALGELIMQHAPGSCHLYLSAS